jgi:hypothetical protein
MKIVRHPYQANIVPQAVQEDALWQCVIRRYDTAEVVVRHDARSKEDAHALALLEISRLKRTQHPLRNAS